MHNGYATTVGLVALLAFIFSVIFVLPQFAAAKSPTSNSSNYVDKDVVGGISTRKDGDSFIITTASGEDIEIRLFGVDTPEHESKSCKIDGERWDCGQFAKTEFYDYVGDRLLTCRGVTYDKYGRLVATCYLGKVDLAAWLVINGLGQICETFSQAYKKQEQTAKKRRAGIWRGDYKRSYQCRIRK